MTATLEKIIVDERNEGLAEGIAEGITKGRIETLISLVSEGLLTLSQAAEKAGESEQTFSQRLQNQ